MRSRWIGLCPAVLPILLVAAACGGGNDPARRATPEVGDTTGTGATGSGSVIADADCREYASSFAGFTPDPANPTGASNFLQIADLFDQLAEKVPNEISNDFRVVAKAYRDFAEGTGGVNFNDPASLQTVPPEELQRIQESLKGLDTEEVRTSVANIERFVQEHCGQG